ncbi:MAG: site-specific integrase, partial [Nocardioidaceae bacterium]|nr:site-specific integrase [Nocardioidaceae bacterium]
MSGAPRVRRGFGRVEKRANGRYRAAYTGPDSQLYRAPTTFASKDDAIAWLSARRAEIEMQIWAPDVAARGQATRSVPNLQAYADIWVETRKTKGRALRPTTRRQYRMLLENFIYPTFGDRRIDRITTEDVNEWYDALAPGRETIRAQSYSLLRTILGSAASERPNPLIPYNPAHIRGAGNAKRVHQVQPATLEELRIIVEELPDRYKLMALLAAWCALRFGELTELRRGDIDLRAGRVKIRRGVVLVDGEFIVGPPKTDAGIRDVAIPPHLMPAVRNHLAQHTASGRDALLFPASANEDRHMAPATLYKVYYPAREAAGRPDLRWHDLRHTGAVLAAQTG